MKIIRLIRKSYSIITGVATNESNLKHNGEVGGMKSLCLGPILKSGVPNPRKIYKNMKAEETFNKIRWIEL